MIRSSTNKAIGVSDEAGGRWVNVETKVPRGREERRRGEGGGGTWQS